jgi:two-component sensor histidine kinase
MLDFFRRLFDTEGFPPRWRCGTGWTSELGWTHIISDIAIWGAYTAIPIVLAIFVIQRKDVPFPRIFWLFVAFIFFCGTGHLIEAIIFWEPVYRLSALVKVGTAVVSVATVCALIPTMPRALSLRSPEQLEREVDLRTRSLQESEARQRVLMSELDHRVKNNITAIMSLAEQTIASTGDFDRFREAFMGRLLAISRTHELLSQSKWSGADLRTIAERTLEPYESMESHRLMLDGAEVQLDAKSSSSVCMAVHELATNSIKYGAISVVGGSVALTWHADESGLHITWVERGGPSVTAPEMPGFGTTLIKGMIVHDLGGSAEFSFEPSGLRCEMVIPPNRFSIQHGEGRSVPNDAGERSSS